jgi:hypothetical protein
MNITLTRGKLVVIDEADAVLVMQHNWYAMPTRRKNVWYATTRVNGSTAYMHRLIMGEPRGVQIDHVDGDGLNNRRSNLRLANCSEQGRNSRAKRKRAAKSSKYKGVSWHTIKKQTKKGIKVSGCWRAEIELPGRKRLIRYAKTEEQAAELYNALARDHFGEFARPNTGTVT